MILVRIAYETDLTLTTISIENFPETSTYYWRVRADKGTEQGPYSDVWQINTAPVNSNAVLAAPTLNCSC